MYIGDKYNDSLTIKNCRHYNDTSVVVDGFLGSRKTNSENRILDNYVPNNKNLTSIYYKENYTELNGNTGVASYLDTLTGASGSTPKYYYLSPAFSTNGNDGNEAGTFRKIRYVHPYCTYGIKNSVGTGKEYNEIVLSDILSDDFFKKEVDD